jgi:hypothetical protein
VLLLTGKAPLALVWLLIETLVEEEEVETVMGVIVQMMKKVLPHLHQIERKKDKKE